MIKQGDKIKTLSGMIFIVDEIRKSENVVIVRYPLTEVRMSWNGYKRVEYIIDNGLENAGYTKLKNQLIIHVARDKNGELFGYFGKPAKTEIGYEGPKCYTLDSEDPRFKNIKFESGPVKVMVE